MTRAILLLVLAGCSEPPSESDASSIEIRIYRGPDVSDALVNREMRALERMYAPLRFTVRDAGTMELRAATAGMLDQIPEDPTPVERTAIWREMLGPALSFIRDESVPARRAVNVVFLPRIAPERSHARRLLPHLTGLTFAPGEDADPDVAALIGERFTPTVFLSAHDIRRLRRLPPSTLAHEMGHALGLMHVDDPNNVMAPTPPSSEPRLTEAQRASLRLP